MDREILFRGKRIDNREWLYGNLLRTDDDGTCIIQNYVPYHLLKNYEVDPKTVCQYTGLTDKDGRKIFEGDIIRYNKKLFKIVWVQECAHFAAHPMERLSWSPCMTVGTVKVVEVVGNIFDDTELFEGGAE